MRSNAIRQLPEMRQGRARYRLELGIIVRSERGNLVEGSLLRGLLRLTGPMLVAAVLQNVQSLIDLFWVGRLGSTSVAALAMSGTILMMVFPVIMGTATGTVALVSRAVGAGRRDDASDIAGHALILALVLGVVMGVVGWSLADVLCRLLGVAPEVVRQGSAYLRILFLGSFTVCVLFVGNSILQGAGNTVIPMCIMGLANVLNIILDPILIFGLLGFPRMGVQGAALATVLAQLAAAGTVVAVLVKGAAGIRVLAGRWRLSLAPAWRILRIGVPSMGQMLSRSMMAFVLMRIVASCGTAAVAAYGIGLRFHMIILMPAFVLGNATATMVGQNLGAGKPGRASRAAWLAAGIDMAIMAVSAALIIILAPEIIGVFSSVPEVVGVGTAYLRTVSPFYIFAAMSIVLGRALHGAGDTLPPMICTVVSLWGLQVPLAIVLARSWQPPTQGIWWAMAIATAVNGLMITMWFQTGRWKKRNI